jgi:hypothetical protein
VTHALVPLTCLDLRLPISPQHHHLASRIECLSPTEVTRLLPLIARKVQRYFHIITRHMRKRLDISTLSIWNY